MWKKLPNLLFNVVNHQTISINNVIYIIGGSKNSMSPQHEKISVYVISKGSYCVRMRGLDMYEWNYYENTVNPEENSVNPIDRFGHTVVTWKQLGLLFGGCHDNGYCEPDIYLFNPGKIFQKIEKFECVSEKEARWIKVSGVGGNVPLRRDGHSTAVVGDHMFLYGGLVIAEFQSRYYDNKLYQLNLNNWQWTILYHGDYLEPLGRDFSHMLPYKNSLFLIGGRSDNCFQGNSRSDIYDTAIWRFDLRHLSQRRNWEKVHPGYGIICDTVLETNQNCSDRHDIIMSDCPQPRRSFMAAILRDEIIMFGGLYENQEFSVHFNDVWSFNIAQHRWYCLSSIDINHSVPVPLRRGSMTKLNNNCLLLIGGVTTSNCVSTEVTKIVGRSLTLPLNAQPIDFDLIEGNSMINAINRGNQIPVTIYHKTKTPLEGYIEILDDLTLRSTDQVFLLQPQLSLYQKALAVVVTLYTSQQLTKYYMPPEIIWDIESIRISPDAKL